MWRNHNYNSWELITIHNNTPTQYKQYRYYTRTTTPTTNSCDLAGMCIIHCVWLLRYSKFMSCWLHNSQLLKCNHMHTEVIHPPPLDNLPITQIHIQCPSIPTTHTHTKWNLLILSQKDAFKKRLCWIRPTLNKHTHTVDTYTDTNSDFLAGGRATLYRQQAPQPPATNFKHYFQFSLYPHTTFKCTHCFLR